MTCPTCFEDEVFPVPFEPLPSPSVIGMVRCECFFCGAQCVMTSEEVLADAGPGK